MTLTVSTDLSVNTGPSQVEEKLEDKQKALRESIEKGEPKIFGFVISGAAAIAVEKIATLKTVSVCLAVSVVTIIISVIALILYYVDIISNPATRCQQGPDHLCDHQHYATKFSTGVKITISMVNIVQTALSSAFTVMLYNQRRNFTGYTTVSE
ncbi:hypothetical protein ABG768_000788 [Culter alburnus]|uniref:Uncharacterized protein n=1 Tax=Culter alburnus TaxID=194366 RepID=A0AAW2B5H5_CULAL